MPNIEGDIKDEAVKAAKAVARFAERHTFQEAADIAKKFEGLASHLLPSLTLGIGPVGFTVNLGDDLENIVKYGRAIWP